MKMSRSRSAQELISLSFILVLIIVVMSLSSPVFFTARNFSNLLLDMTTVGIIAIFTTMLMIAGGLDLSVGSTVALCSVIIGANQETMGIWTAVALAIAVGALVGLINGFLVTYVGINPLITTLGMFSIVRGLALVISGGLTVPVFDMAGTQQQAYEQFAWLGEGTIAGIPVPVVIMIGLFIIGLVVMRYTTYGRAMYAIGGNTEASKLAGLAVRRYRMFAYIFSGLSAAIASVLLTSRLYAADPNAALGVELTVITAVVLGGVSLAGGKGSMVGTALGVLILSTLLNGMRLQSVSTDYMNIAQGVVLALAVGLDQVRSRNINWRKWSQVRWPGGSQHAAAPTQQ
jgi:ribose/xylose/arabinose/galactoside ABC-type transport system permease subunit